MREEIISEYMNVFYKILIVFFILFFCIIITENDSLAEVCGEMTLPGQKCKIKSLGNWTPQEKWVWNQVCEGKIADLNHRFGNGKNLDPNNPESWKENENRILTARFLRTILLFEPFRSSITERGVQIVGACFKNEINFQNGNIQCVLIVNNSLFKSVNLQHTTFPSLSFSQSTFLGKLDMNSARIGKLFKCDNSKFHGEVNLGNIVVNDEISMIGSTFYDKLNMNSARIGKLFMRDPPNFMLIHAKFNEVDLRQSKIGLIDMDRSTFNGKLNMNGAEIGSSLFMREGAKFREVNLGSASIGGQLSMTGSTFNGKLFMAGAKIARSLYMSDCPKFNDVDLHKAYIGGDLSMDCSTFAGDLIMEGTKIEGDFVLRNAKFLKTDQKKDRPFRFDMLSVLVEGSVDMRRAILTNVDLRRTIIHNELIISEINYATTFLPKSELDLRFAEVRHLVAHPKIEGLKNVRLNGFQYKFLGGFSQKDYDRRSSDSSILFMKEWVYKSETPLPFTYKQLSRALINMGMEDQARQVMYDSKKKQMLYDWNNQNIASAIWLTFLMVLFGYGYKLWYTLIWILCLLIIGWFFARRSKIVLPNSTETIGFWYSFDRLLPIIELRKVYYEVDLDGLGRIYFYVHTMMGYVLSTCILANLSGLVGKI